VVVVVVVVVQAAYFIVTTAIGGASPGQRLAGLRVVDTHTGRRPSWRQSASRWAVWAGPGIVARLAISTYVRPSAKHKAQSASLHEELDRLADEISDDPDKLEEQLSQLHRGRRTAAMWVPVVVTAVLLVAYRLTVGRGAHDRLSGTHVVAIR
jgi:uncharacterized RDD family membrane protein YckC